MAVTKKLEPTGLRASDRTGLRCADIQLTAGPHVRCAGKGRKNRITPLTPTTTAVLEVWLAERARNREAPAFPTARGGRLTPDRSTIGSPITSTSRRNSARRCTRRASPRTRSGTPPQCASCTGVDTTVIALWLGRERVDTTQIYLHANLALKKRAIARTTRPDTRPGREEPPDTLLAFLEAL
jgi:integrase/recombinase XerD